VHHSGSGWLARPSPWGTCTSYSLPASWRTPRWVNRVIWLSAGYFRSSPGSGCRNGRSSCLKGANRRHRACTPLDNFLSEALAFTRKGQSERDFSCWRAPSPSPLFPPQQQTLVEAARPSHYARTINSGVGIPACTGMVHSVRGFGYSHRSDSFSSPLNLRRPN